MAEDSAQQSTENASQPTKEPTAASKEPTAASKKKSSSLFSRFFKSIFGSRSSDDYEKKLQYLSKEEATVHARLKRRARSWRQKARNIIVFSVVIEALAVAYAIMTTRSVDLDWKMRAARVFPMFGLPILSTLVYSTLASFTRMLNRKDQKALERLRAERQAKIDELKERTNYYITQQLIQRYDEDPAAKQAAATVLASKLGADSGLKVYVGDESNSKPQPLGRSTNNNTNKSTGLRNRKLSHLRSNSTGNAALTQLIDETNIDHIWDNDDDNDDGEEEASDRSKIVANHKGPSPNDGGWLARLVALLVGEDPTQCYALICGNCHMHNGLARKEDFQYITYYCPHCHALNSQQPGVDHPSSSASEQITPMAISDGKSPDLMTSPKNLETVQELPETDEKETEAEAGTETPDS